MVSASRNAGTFSGRVTSTRIETGRSERPGRQRRSGDRGTGRGAGGPTCRGIPSAAIGAGDRVRRPHLALGTGLVLTRAKTSRHGADRGVLRYLRRITD